MLLTVEQKEHFAELSLIIALPICIKDKEYIKGTRLNSILDRLTKHAQKMANMLPTVSAYDTACGLDRILEFGQATGWTRQVDTISVVSFLLGLIEHSQYKYPQSIINALNDAFDRLTREETEDFEHYIQEAERALNIWRNKKI